MMRYYTMQAIGHRDMFAAANDRVAVVGPLLAWRYWRGEGDRLVSAETWPVGEPLTASCLHPFRRSHDAPAPGCGCGIYGVMGWPQVVHPLQPHRVVGQVTLWGRVVRHEWGYRAQYARPVALLVLYRGQREEVQRLAEAYGVEVLAPSLAERRAEGGAYLVAEIGGRSVAACAVCLEGADVVIDSFPDPLPVELAGYLVRMYGAAWPLACVECGRRWSVALAREATPRRRREAIVEWLPDDRVRLTLRAIHEPPVMLYAATLGELRDAAPSGWASLVGRAVRRAAERIPPGSL